MTKRHTFTAALMAAGLMGAPAFAQDAMEEKLKDKAETVMKDKMDAVRIKDDSMTDSVDGTVTVKGDPVIIQTPDQTLIVKDGEMSAGDSGMMIKGREIMTKGAEVPELTTPVIKAPVTTVEIACPDGTTAQPDGTCLMTGE